MSTASDLPEIKPSTNERKNYHRICEVLFTLYHQKYYCNGNAEYFGVVDLRWREYSFSLHELFLLIARCNVPNTNLVCSQ